MALVFRYCSCFMFLLWVGSMIKYGIILEAQMFLLIGGYGLVMDWRYRRVEDQQAASSASQLLLACSNNYGAAMQQSAHHSGPYILADMEIRNETPEVRVIALGEPGIGSRNSDEQPYTVVSHSTAA